MTSTTISPRLLSAGDVLLAVNGHPDGAAPAQHHRDEQPGMRDGHPRRAHAGVRDPGSPVGRPALGAGPVDDDGARLQAGVAGYGDPQQGGPDERAPPIRRPVQVLQPGPFGAVEQVEEPVARRSQ